jgi:hypothetical protein
LSQDWLKTTNGETVHTLAAVRTSRASAPQEAKNQGLARAEALSELEDVQKETSSTLMAQMIEVQAMLQVIIELQKLSLTAERRFDREELDVFCRTRIEEYRKHFLEVIKQNVSCEKFV